MIEQLQNEIAYYITRIEEIGLLVSILDIVLVAVLIFVVLMLVRGTRAVQVLRGLIVLALLFIALDTILPLTAMRSLLNTISLALIVAIPVIFQPELRRALEQLGRAGSSLRWFRRETDQQPMIRAHCRSVSPVVQSAPRRVDRDRTRHRFAGVHRHRHCD